MKIHFIIRTFKGWGVPAKVSTLCKIKTNINTRMTEFPHHVTCKRCKKLTKNRFYLVKMFGEYKMKINKKAG